MSEDLNLVMAAAAASWHTCTASFNFMPWLTSFFLRRGERIQAIALFLRIVDSSSPLMDSKCCPCPAADLASNPPERPQE